VCVSPSMLLTRAGWLDLRGGRSCALCGIGHLSMGDYVMGRGPRTAHLLPEGANVAYAPSARAGLLNNLIRPQK